MWTKAGKSHNGFPGSRAGGPNDVLSLDDTNVEPSEIVTDAPRMRCVETNGFIAPSLARQKDLNDDLHRSECVG